MLTASPSGVGAPSGPPDRGITRLAAQAMVVAYIWRVIAGIFSSIIENIAERRRIRRTIGELEGLSDRMLADIGLNRCDIGRVARHGRDSCDRRA